MVVGTAEQWIKEGKNAVKSRKLSCCTFKDNQTRLQLFALAYTLANFLRRLALPRDVKHWSLTTIQEKLVKIGAKVTRHAKYVTFHWNYSAHHGVESSQSACANCTGGISCVMHLGY